MWLFLTALAVLFAAALLVVIVVRLQSDGWPDELPPLPTTLWISTGILLASAVSMQWSLIAIRSGRHRSCVAALVTTLLLAIVFLVLQTMAWFEWTSSLDQAGVLIATNQLAQSTFLVLTGLHAAHIIGGLIPLGLICWYAIIRSYSSQDHVAIRDTAMYWHFLDVVWILLVIFMFFMI